MRRVLYATTSYVGITLIGYALFYVAASVAGRALGPADFGIVGAMLNMVALLVIPAYSLQLVVARQVAHLEVRGRDAGVRLMRARLWTATVAGTAALVPLLAVTALLAGQMDLDSPLPALLTIVGLVPYLIVGVLRGALHGEGRYRDLGVTTVLEGAGRFATCVAAAAVGAGVTLFVLAPMLGAILAIAGAVVMLRASHAPPSPPTDETLEAAEGPADWRTPLWYAAFAVMTNVDVLLGRAILGDHEAGELAAAALYGRIPIVVALAVGAVVLAETSRARSTGQDRLALLLAPLGALTLVLGAISVVGYAVPPLIASVLVGPEYPGAEELFGPYGLAMLAFGILVVLSKRELAEGGTVLPVACGVAAPIQIVATVLLADTALGIVFVELAVGAALCAIGAATAVRRRRAEVRAALSASAS
ncbi:MAG TPA: hypothetical protein VNZ62_13245 [Capillimicrobium sp.]|nr:hypothetical protein [Capillimicrobium sp.]